MPLGQAQDPRLATWVRHQYAAVALEQVLVAFDREGIDALPVKGVVLAPRLYGSLADRPMGDVDLRVRPADLQRVARVASASGWPVRRTSRQLGTLDLDVCNTLIEIETTIGPPGVCAVDVDAMLRRSTVQTAPFGFRHREPEVHDHALVLCVNAFKDQLRFAPPTCATDLALLARRPEFHADRMVSRAREARLTALVWLVADWLERRTPGTTWGEVLIRLGSVPPRPVYARAFAATIRSPSASSVAAAAVLARTCSDDWWMRCKALGLGALGTALALGHHKGWAARTSA